MKLHTILTRNQIYQAMKNAKARGLMTGDIIFIQFTPENSRSRPNGYLIQLGTYNQTTGPTRSRHYKNTGNNGSASEHYGREGAVWAATYDEWGWFIAELFSQDPDAIFGDYKGIDDFRAQTNDKYR